MEHKFDFGGWATRNDLRCSDGRIIRKDAFKDNDGQIVPLVWQHRHDDPTNVLGHALLENRDEGVYAYCTFNETENGQYTKALVQHGDVTSLSIYANQLKQNGHDVLHGAIKEVSIVLAGANPGAYIDNPVLAHSDGSIENIDDEALIFTGEEISLAHEDLEEDMDKKDNSKEGGKVPTEKNGKTVKDVFDSLTDEQKQVVYFMIGQAIEDSKNEKLEDDDEDDESIQHADEDDEKDADKTSGEKTVKDVFDSFTDEQKQVVYFMIGQAIEDSKKEIEHYDFEGDYDMKYNVFDTQTAPQGNFLSHSDEEQIIASAKKYGSFKQAVEDYAEANELMHADGDPAPVSGFTSYGDTVNTTGVGVLFPEYHDVRPGAPEVVTNDQAWVKAVLNKVHKSPYSRIRTRNVDIRNIEALRAKGYLKGKEKVLAGNYTVANRTTEPQTVYVKSALNRDDIVDITDFDYVKYQYDIDRMELEKELAQAILVGDTREVTDPDKINPERIRPIWTDADIFTIHKVLNISDSNGTNTGANFGPGYRYASAMEELVLDAKIDYRGSGSIDMFTTQKAFNQMQLAKDLNGRRIYANKNELMSALDVNNIYNVPEFENRTRTVNGKTLRLVAILGNLNDYAMGATKGGEITHFNQFDIDFNQQKSLLETRCSGATTRLYSFIVIEEEVTDDDDEDTP